MANSRQIRPVFLGIGIVSIGPGIGISVPSNAW